jgi:aspartokinase/homoserine dehydrogenase 1
MVVAVGEKMRGIHGLAGRMFGALGRRSINIIAIAQGSSEISISIAVKSDEVPDALKAIHEEFEL